MPFYEYRCSACGHQLEALQKMSDEPLRECPACGKAELVKQFSVAGIRGNGPSIDNLPACASGGCGAACQGRD